MKTSLYERLKQMDLVDFGSHIPRSLVHEILGIEIPEYGTLKEFQELQLLELKEIDMVRSILIKSGRYLAQENGDYRVLLPSENQAQIKNMLDGINRKAKKAETLMANTPIECQDKRDNTMVRIQAIKNSLNSRFRGFDSGDAAFAQ